MVDPFQDPASPSRGDFEQVINNLVHLRYQPAETTIHVSDDRPAEGPGWNSNHPIFSIDTLWRHQLKTRRPDILVHYTTTHGLASRPSLYGTLFRGVAPMRRSGFIVRGTRELHWSGIDGLTRLLEDQKIL